MSSGIAVITHIYGAASLIPGLVSIFYLVNKDATWREYVLVGSGWAAATLFALLLFIMYRRMRDDAEELGKIREQLATTAQQLDRRGETADFLASMLVGRNAKPRAGKQQVKE